MNLEEVYELLIDYRSCGKINNACLHILMVNKFGLFEKIMIHIE